MAITMKTGHHRCDRWLAGIVAGVLSIAWAMGASAATAATSEKDMQIAMRAVTFWEDTPSGQAVAAIVYDPANESSKSEAEVIKGFLEANPSAGSASLVPKLVAVGDLSGLSGASVAFVTEGLGGQHEAIFSKAAGAGVLTISSDRACVEAGKCVVSVTSKPRVEIVVNKSAADASSVAFQSAFLMLVKEI